MSVTRGVLGFVGGCALVGATAWAEDLTIVSNVTVSKAAPRASTEYISKDKLRTGNGETETIIEYSTGRMIQIDHKKKEYSETSLAEISAALGRLQGMPFADKLGGKVEEVTVQKGSASKKIAGYDCNQYILSMGDSLQFDMWAAPGLETPFQYYE